MTSLGRIFQGSRMGMRRVLHPLARLCELTCDRPAGRADDA